MTGRFRGPGKYNPERAASAVAFLEMCPHIRGKWARGGGTFKHLPWQLQVTQDVYGVLNKDGSRQYRTIYVEVPKKNGKTTWSATHANYLFKHDDEPGPEVYCAAYDKDQAGITFGTASAMLKRMAKIDVLAESYKTLRFQDYRKTVLDSSDEGLLRALEREARGQHGWNISGLIFDEFHTQRSPELWDVLQDGTISRFQPLTWIITTAGFDRTSPCWRLHEYARKVLAGEIEDPTFYPVIYSAADEGQWEDFDWLDERRWIRANPSLGETVFIDEMRQRAKKAQEIPNEQNLFKRLRLNIWTQAETRWIPGAAWDNCTAPIVEESMVGAPAFGGLDMASTTDVASFVALIPRGEHLVVVPRFWIPEETIAQRSRDNGVPYEWWAKSGLVVATPGNAIDFDAIERNIRTDFIERFRMQTVGYDQWNAEHMAQRLSKHDVEMVKFPQSFGSFNSPTRALLKLVLSQQLQHDGNAVLRWMMDNLMVSEDSNLNVKPNKQKSTEKIDGMVALIMAVGMWLHTEDGESVYETRGIISL